MELLKKVKNLSNYSEWDVLDLFNKAADILNVNIYRCMQYAWK